MEYQNVAPEQKFGAVSIQNNGSITILVSQCLKGAFDAVPLPARVGIIASMLCYKLITDNGEVPIAQAIVESANWASYANDKNEPVREMSQVDGDPEKGAALVEVSLAYLKKVWPYDFAVANLMIPNKKAAAAMISPGAISDSTIAFAPEGSAGFVRELAGIRGYACRAPLKRVEADDPAALIFAALTGQSAPATQVVDLASEEVEFPAPQ